jgi:hypothetical protein
MMNEFPPAYIQAHRRIAGQAGDSNAAMATNDTLPSNDTLAINGTEYLELLEAAGVKASDYPQIQAVQQHKLWQQVGSQPSAESVQTAIAQLKASDASFSMAGASWTNNLSWVEGYANVLEPMNQLSARFHQAFAPLVAQDPGVTSSHHYQEALLYLLLLETSCFRYWGQGTWTDYASEIHRRGIAAIG